MLNLTVSLIGKLFQEMGSGLVRIALECEKKVEDTPKLLEEPVWNTYCNGRRIGYCTKRDPSEADLTVMQLLSSVSMGAGVLPIDSSVEGSDGEMTYMRAPFDCVVGSKDSETYYMLNPDGNGGPELSIFFVRM